MCLPHADVSAPAPVAVQSLQSASALDLGGAPRGAAQLGRLKLRLDGSQAQAPAATPLSDALGLPTSGGSSSGSSTDTAQTASGSFQLAPNNSLRLPA